MPRRSRRSSSSNSDIWLWIIIAIIVIIVFALIKKFIDDNPWVRWLIFVCFTALFIFCVDYFVQGIHSKTFNVQWVCALVGAIFSFLLFNAQTDFFRTWWADGAWLVWVFNSVVIVWLLYLFIKLLWEWRQRRSRGFP